jgi:hypothetical protein
MLETIDLATLNFDEKIYESYKFIGAIMTVVHINHYYEPFLLSSLQEWIIA